MSFVSDTLLQHESMKASEYGRLSLPGSLSVMIVDSSEVNIANWQDP